MTEELWHAAIIIIIIFIIIIIIIIIITRIDGINFINFFLISMTKHINRVDKNYKVHFHESSTTIGWNYLGWRQRLPMVWYEFMERAK